MTPFPQLKPSSLQNEGHVSQARHKKHEQFSQTNGHNVQPIHPSIQRMDEWKEEVAKDEKRKSMTWLLYSNPSNQSGAAPTPSYRLRVKCRHFLAQATHKHQQSTDNPGRIDEQNVRTIHPCSTGMDEGNVRRMKREMHPASQLWSSGEGSEGRVKDGALEAEGKWVKL